MRIIIVDDEGITRQWLKKKIEELDMNYHVTGEFINGRQACDYLKEQNVDVIFTDIRMPVMDGLEFLSEIKDQKTAPYKIILSAYDEFHYVRQAMRLGAHEFILKPEITKEKLAEILSTAEKFLRERRNISIGAADSGTDFETYYVELLEKGGSPDEIEKHLEKSTVELKPDNIVTVLFTISGKQDKEKVLEVAKLYMEQEKISGYCMYIGKQEYVILYNQRISSNREAVINKMTGILKKYFGGACCAGVSVRKNGYDSLKELFRQAEAAKENRDFFHEDGVQLYDHMEIQKKDGNWYFSHEIKNIIKSLKEGNLDTAATGTLEFLEKAANFKEIYPAYLRTLCMEILTAYIQNVREFSLKKQEEEQVRYIEMRLGNTYKTLEELKTAVLTYQTQLAEIIRKKSSCNNYSIPVRKIICYIDDHFQDKISLEQIAEEIHMNRTYISVLFKKETGIKFSDYLQKVRLKKAGKMIEETRVSIQEIAEQTGFFDAAHLSRVFKENYQMTPLEYRRKNTNFVQKDK